MGYHYVPITEYQSDVMLRWRSNSEDPWILQNPLPFMVCVHYAPQPGRGEPGSTIDDTTVGVLTCIPGGKEVKVPGHHMRPNDIIYVSALPEHNTIMPPYRLNGAEKKIRLGTVAYDPLPPTPAFHNLYAELSGMNVYNHFSFPIDVYNDQGALLASDITSRVYIDNVRWGFHVGDTVTIKAFGKLLYTFTIVDPIQKEVHVGIINAYDQVPKMVLPPLRTAR